MVHISVVPHGKLPSPAGFEPDGPSTPAIEHDDVRVEIHERVGAHHDFAIIDILPEDAQDSSPPADDVEALPGHLIDNSAPARKEK